jgi:hypothetical protein
VRKPAGSGLGPPAWIKAAVPARFTGNQPEGIDPMTYVTNPCDLAGLVAYVAPYLTPALIAEIDAADCYADGELRFYGRGALKPCIAAVYADGAVEVVA